MTDLNITMKKLNYGTVATSGYCIARSDILADTFNINIFATDSLINTIERHLLQNVFAVVN